MLENFREIYNSEKNRSNYSGLEKIRSGVTTIEEVVKKAYQTEE